MNAPELFTLANPSKTTPATTPRAARATRDRDVEPLVRQVVEALEEDIVFGYLHPRERLVEDDLRERFGLKRHVVRQVLAELEQMGLIERKKNIGACVKSYTIKEVVDLYITREILETSCVHHIPFPVPQDKLDELTALQGNHDQAVATSDLRSAFRANIAFHNAMFALSGNAMLTELIELAAQRAHTIRSLSMVYPHLLEKARRDHWGMIEALRDGDRARLADLCRDHLIPSRNAYIEQQARRVGKSLEDALAELDKR
ncbi:MAG: GntR family transcriptional regulator [Burkholderiaceae bacterium]